jgi:hypothetical protein
MPGATAPGLLFGLVLAASAARIEPRRGNTAAESAAVLVVRSSSGAQRAPPDRAQEGQLR